MEGSVNSPAQDMQFALQKEDHDFQLQMQQQQHKHENEIEEKELGYIGRIFGSSEHSSKNITAFVLILLILGCIGLSIFVYMGKNDADFILNILKWVAPIITLSLGYLFGKK